MSIMPGQASDRETWTLHAAITGHISLATGLLLNEGSALLIIANGLRLLRRRADQPEIALGLNQLDPLPVEPDGSF